VEDRRPGVGFADNLTNRVASVYRRAHVNTHRTVVLVLVCALLLSASAWAGPQPIDREPASAPPSATQSGSGEAALARAWTDAKNSLKRGAYREALQSLEIILSITPQDPWAQLYRSLCEQRLSSPPPFAQLPRAQFEALEERLRQEARAQQRAVAQQKSLEQQLRTEQVRWDEELKVLDRQAERDEKLKRQAERAAALKREREEAQRRELAQQQVLRTAGSAPTVVTGPVSSPRTPPQPAGEVRETPTPPPQPLAPSAAPAALTGGPVSAPTPATGGPGKSVVELPPVVVQTAPEGAAAKGVGPSSPAVRVRPPAGAVQINARQMSTLPDRRIAIAEGDVEVVFENAVLTCDHLTLFTDTKDAYAEGHVRLEEGDQVFRGEMVHYNFNTKKGRFLQGTIASPPWFEFGRSVEHLAEGVFQVTPGYLTSCDLEPPHFKFYGRRAIFFADDKVARARNLTLFVEQFPLFYLPWMTAADRQSPFFIIPGKSKQWEQYVLTGYRYELPGGPANQRGTLHLDYRSTLLWGGGIDHQFNDPRLGKGLVKLYYNEEQNIREPKTSLPKGAKQNRYRALWRHVWQPLPDTMVLTDIQKLSDANYRKDFLFREEYSRDDVPESVLSVVTNTSAYSIGGKLGKRTNRFQDQTEALPDLTVDVREAPIGETQLFTKTRFGVSNLQTKKANSGDDTDVVRIDWFQQFRYAWNLFRPIEVTPRAGIRQTFYTKDKQGGAERIQGDRNLLSGQVSMGTDASLKLFRVFPVATNALGLDINLLRHVITPTLSYSYIHPPTVDPSLLSFAASEGATNKITFGLENKLQTKRSQGGKGKPSSSDLGRFVISVPYTFRGNQNKNGGVLGDWAFDLETTPWPWLSFESDWIYPSHFVRGSRDSRITTWNTNLAVVNPKTQAELRKFNQRFIQESVDRLFQMKPVGHWALGWSHRYSYNDKTEESIHFELQPSAKWYVSTFQRLTLKEVAGGAKRFNNLREYQFNLVRDLHDWVATLVYRVDREYGEELFFTLSLKAYPNFPIDLKDSYHQPKIGSQSDPFSPLRGQRAL